MKQFYKTLQLLLLLALMGGKTSAQVTVTATAGTLTGSYTTLKEAFDSINHGWHQGAIDIRIHDNTTETASASIDSSGNPTLSNYTSILIRPADTATVVKTISSSVTAIALININGADNMTIDGRAGGTGSTSLLAVNSSSTAANSFNIRLLNGAQNNTIEYVTSIAASNPGVTSVINVLIVAGTAGPVNNNLMIANNDLVGGAQGMQVAGTTALPATGITIYKNVVRNYRTLGFFLAGGIFTITVDSNLIWHDNSYNSNETATIYGMDLEYTPLVNNAVYNITRNTIGNFSMSAPLATSGLQGIRVFPNTSGTGTTTNVVNNSISLMRANNSINGNQVIQGIRYTGTATLTNLNIVHNTVRIGGACIGGTSSTINAIGFLKSNSSVGASNNFKNNVVVVERTSNNGLFTVGFWMSSLSGVNSINYNNYYVAAGNYNAVWNGSVYTAATNYSAAAIPNEQNVSMNAVNFAADMDLSITGASIQDAQTLKGTPSTLAPTDLAGTLRSTAYPYKGAYESTAFPLQDAKLVEVYTLGKLPIPYANPHTFRAAISNVGIDTMYNVWAYTEVSAPNAFIDSVMIDTLPVNQTEIVTFTNPFTYTATGSGTVTMSVADDGFNGNNSKAVAQNVTTGTYGYAIPGLAAAGGVGFTGVAGDFVAKFPYSGSNAINQVGVSFSGAGGNTYQIVIFDMLNDTPGTLLWNSSTLISASGVNTINVNPTVAVTGTFFVGVRQIGTTNVGFAYQTEDPIRSNVFFYKATTVPAWVDFSSTNSSFRFMVEPRLQIADDIGAQFVTQPCNLVVQNSAPIFPQVNIFNYGLNTQTSVIVQSEISGPTSFSSSDTFNSISLASNASMPLILANSSFNPTTSGIYTMKVWTILPADLEPNNDTITYVFTVEDINTATDAGNNLTLNGTNQFLSVNDNPSLDFTSNMMTMEGWVNWTSFGGNNTYLFAKEQSGGTSKFEFYITPAGTLTFKIQTTGGTDSIVSTKFLSLLNYSHVAATYDGSEIKLYLNGDTAGSKFMSGNMMTSASQLFIGRHFAGSGFLGASLDELRIWDTVRTESQIRSNLHTRLPNFANTALKGYWRFDEAAGNYAADAAGNCNTALLNAAPVFSASTIPLGTPVVGMQTVNASGVTTVPGVSIDLNAYNQIGSNDYYIHKFPGLPVGTSPATVPGGIANVHPNNWIIYRYGDGTMDSAEVLFSVIGIPATAVNSDVQLFTRGVGENGGWVNTRSQAFSLSYPTQVVSMTLGAPEFNKQFVLGGNNGALPVTLLHFTGRSSNDDVILKWATASELNNAGFTVERSVDGKNFIKVTDVKSKGNSNVTIEYSTVDQKAFTLAASRILYYRLVQTDFSGTKTYSNIAKVIADKVSSSEVSVYPNPFNSEVKLVADIAAAGQARVVMVDITGRKVYELSTQVDAGVRTIETNGLDQLPKGIYLLQLTINGDASTHKITKQ